MLLPDHSLLEIIGLPGLPLCELQFATLPIILPARSLSVSGILKRSNASVFKGSAYEIPTIHARLKHSGPI